MTVLAPGGIQLLGQEEDQRAVKAGHSDAGRLLRVMAVEIAGGEFSQDHRFAAAGDATDDTGEAAYT